MNRKTNVLIFPAGEINSVELHEALSHNVNICVYGASSVDRHGPLIFKNYRSGLPFITDKSFIENFNSLLEEWNIDFVFPTHDTVALFLAKNRDVLKASVIAADAETAEICRDKKKTYALFSDQTFCPAEYDEIACFPCFIKPREGQGSNGAKLIEKEEDIPAEFKADEYVITEYLPGKELTVDCISDAEGNLAAVLPRERNRTMAGVSVSGTAVQADGEIRSIGETINKRLHFNGLWYFQIKKDKYGHYKLLEISARCAGTMCLSRARGVNLPLLSVYSAMGRNISVFENPYEIRVDRTLISRYVTNINYSSVYIDYDDTVVENDEVCLPVIRFLYQCRNSKKNVVLLTRHEQDHGDSIADSLRKHAVSEHLFSEIICIPEGREKSDYITEKESVFIDNAYAERKKVHEKLGIPVFDVEGVEVLTDWRC